MYSRYFKRFSICAVTAITLIAPPSASATPVSINVAGTYSVASGTLSSLLGAGFTSGFTYDTDLAAAIPVSVEFGSPAAGGTGQELGAEFNSGSVSSSTSVPGFVFPSPTSIAEQENDVTRTGEELLDLLPGGVFDFFSVNGWGGGSTFVGGSTISESTGEVINGVSIDLVFIGNMFGPDLTATTPMPGTLDLGLVTNVLVSIEEISAGETVGFAFQFGTIGEGGTFNNFTIESNAQIAEPGSLLIFGLGLGLLGLRRRNSA